MRAIAAVLLILTGLASVISPVRPAQAAVLDVCPSGCTYSSIQAAIDAAGSSETVLIGSGTYVEQLSITKTVTLEGAGSATTFIQTAGNGPVVGISEATNVVINGVTIEHTGGTGGSGIFSGNSSVTISSSVIRNNPGGGISNMSSTMTIDNTTISGNSATWGGGIQSYSTASLTISSSIISGNTALQGGGGVNNDGTLIVTDSTFSGNTAAYGGGIRNAHGGTMTVSGSTFDENSVTDDGGGVYADNTSSTTIINSTFAGNTAEETGGGIFVDRDSTITVNYSTLSGNSATDTGGVYNDGDLDLSNSIVANNTGGNCGGSRHNGGSNLYWPDGFCGGLYANPLLGPLADNGGPTLTMAPQPGSPAFDQNRNCPTPTTDQRGVERPQGRACDIGAVEIVDTTQPSITPVVTGTVGTNGWYTTDVTVSWTVQEPESRIISSSGCGTTTVTEDRRFTILTCGATSTGGTNADSVTINRDATLPLLAPTVTPNPVVANQPATASANATDAMSGIASQECETPDTSSVGIHTVTCTATDRAGNVATANVSYTVTDPSAPVITPTVTGTTGANGWFTSDVSVTWSVADTESEITSTSGCGQTVITTDTPGTPVTCSATSAGGTASQSVTIQRDTTAPVITFTGNRGVYAMTATVAITCTASDATSSIADSTCPNVSVPASSFGPGEHVITASATDGAGHTTTAETRFTVGGGSYAGLRTLTMSVVDHRPTEQVLIAYLQAAEQAEKRGRPGTEASALLIYRIGVQLAIRLGHVSASDGQLLLDWSYTV